MENITKRKLIFFSLLAVVLAGMVLYIYIGFPKSVNIFEGEALEVAEDMPLYMSVQAADGGMLMENGMVGRDTFGGYDLQLKLFGILPVRSVHVNVTESREVVPCGNAIGIKIITAGVLVVGTAEVKNEAGRMVFPAKDYDIREGDVISAVGGVEVGSTEQFGELVKSAPEGEAVFTIKRNGRQMERVVRAVNSSDGYKLGIWVRDSTAGIGTLTFMDEQTGAYGALGHPVTDSDTGSVMEVSEGEIPPASILSVQKGVKGTPGELKGIFKSMENRLGSIEKNTEQGIYGVVDGNNKQLYNGALPTASRSDIKEGKAAILANIDEAGVKQFEIEIQKVNRFGNDNNKDMVIHVTDPLLLEETGGIVQGMSGSPIIQDGALIGAVTHVFVGDPTRGYGIFIENMLANAA